jgi:sporulation protein YlmC with PRC-barrel domain
MVWNASTIRGYAVVASDGKIGTVNDLLFDDTTWLVRWLVVETGSWLSSRKVLLPSSALGYLDAQKQECLIRLTMQQVKDSPDVDTDRPVSRQMETGTYAYYGYNPFWNSGYGQVGDVGFLGGYGYMGGMGGAMLLPPGPDASGSPQGDDKIGDAARSSDDVHLRSVAAVCGYHIQASDGEIGHVETFLVALADWSIRYLVVDTTNWWPGRKVLISPLSIRKIEWLDRLVELDVDRRTVKESPAYDETKDIDDAYDEAIRLNYGVKPFSP